MEKNTIYEVEGLKEEDKKLNIYLEDNNILVLCFPFPENPNYEYIYKYFDNIKVLYTGVNTLKYGIENLTIKEINNDTTNTIFTFAFPRNFEYLKDVASKIQRTNVNFIYNKKSIGKPKGESNKYNILLDYKKEIKKINITNMQEVNIKELCKYQKVNLIIKNNKENFNLKEVLNLEVTNITVGSNEVDNVIKSDDIKRKFSEIYFNLNIKSLIEESTIINYEALCSFLKNISIYNQEVVQLLLRNLQENGKDINLNVYHQIIEVLYKNNLLINKGIDKQLALLNMHIVHESTQSFNNHTLSDKLSLISKLNYKKPLLSIIIIEKEFKSNVTIFENLLKNNDIECIVLTKDTKSIISGFEDKKDSNIKYVQIKENNYIEKFEKTVKHINSYYVMIIDEEFEFLNNSLKRMKEILMEGIPNVCILNNVVESLNRVQVSNSNFLPDGMYSSIEQMKDRINFEKLTVIYKTTLLQENLKKYQNPDFLKMFLATEQNILYSNQICIKYLAQEQTKVEIEKILVEMIEDSQEEIKKLNSKKQLLTLQILDTIIFEKIKKHNNNISDDEIRNVALSYLKLRKKIIGDTYIPKVFFLIKKQISLDFLNLEKIKELQNKLDEKEYYKYVVEYFSKLGLSRDLDVYLGFDFEYKGNSKYHFYKNLMKKKNVVFVTNSEQIPNSNKVAPNSLEFIYVLARAKKIYLESYINSNYYFSPESKVIQFWHGIPIKKIGLDTHEPYILERNEGDKTKNYQMRNYSKFYSPSEYSDKVLSSAFQTFDNLKRKNYPRVDYLIKNKDNELLKETLKRQIGIKKKNKVVLYCPTWRDKWIRQPDYSMLIDFSKYKISKNTKIIILLHPYIKANIPTALIINKNIIIPERIETQDLILVSDVCISDYSSIVYDFLELNKEVYLYWKDYEEYNEYRGIYKDAKEQLKQYVCTEEKIKKELNFKEIK